MKFERYIPSIHGEAKLRAAGQSEWDLLLDSALNEPQFVQGVRRATIYTHIQRRGLQGKLRVLATTRDDGFILSPRK